MSRILPGPFMAPFYKKEAKMDADVVMMYRERVREEMSVGEYDDAIIEFYLHGDCIVKRYLNEVAAEPSKIEVLAVH